MLPKQNRLRLKKDFERIFETGRWGGTDFISLKYAKNEDGDDPKIGFMVGKKVSKSAVKRNRVKRQMREVVRLALKKGQIKPNFDVIVVAKPKILGRSHFEIEQTLKNSLIRARILNKQ